MIRRRTNGLVTNRQPVTLGVWLNAIAATLVAGMFWSSVLLAIVWLLMT